MSIFKSNPIRLRLFNTHHHQISINISWNKTSTLMYLPLNTPLFHVTLPYPAYYKLIELKIIIKQKTPRFRGVRVYISG